MLPRSWGRAYCDKITESLTFLREVHEADSLRDDQDRRRALDALGDEIARRNDLVLHHGVANQAFPVNRQIGGRRFDELGWQREMLEEWGVATTAAGEPLPPR